MSHSERNIIITGAGSGIGAAAARAFSESGDRAHLFDLSLKQSRSRI
ncbi:short chain dehydrogenase [Klebsiella pneumoniae]|jgi:NAD(P)-dependent dehydrogenase (short-subunit alcohol dehydrogenase family)|nr:short chain dehydrogenase [Klebsiella pneumoniae]